MLSHDLRNVAHIIVIGIDAGCMTPELMREVADRLVNLAGVAKQLERTAVVAIGGGHDPAHLPPNVVAITAKLDRPGVPAPAGGGDVA